jgi:hypothetical protein
VIFQEQLTPEQAQALIKSGLGAEELRLATSFCAPLFWQVEDKSGLEVRNGTAFFVDAGEGVFGVTAWHVIDGYFNSRETRRAGRITLGGNGRSLPLEWPDRIIDAHLEIDIATFRVTRAEIELLGKTILTGSQTSWPPQKPTVNRGVVYCGYPQNGTPYLARDTVQFGAVPGSGIATGVTPMYVSSLIERDHLLAQLGKGLPPEDYDFGGISGGPMLAVMEGALRTFTLAGVIYSGPSTSLDPSEAISGFEMIYARRSHFILPSGNLDKHKWERVKQHGIDIFAAD